MGSVHLLQPAPSCQARSGDDHREATSASLPIAESVAVSASAGTPAPGGLPAMRRSKLVAMALPCVKRTVSAPSLPPTPAVTVNGRVVSIPPALAPYVPPAI